MTPETHVRIVPGEPGEAMEKLYIVIRSDLAPGAQIAQSAHALSAFACAHPEKHREWHEGSNNLVIVSVADEAALQRLLERAACRMVGRASFREPDFGDAMTAIALYGAEAGKLVSSLPLALRQLKAA
jgi:hypothetical protein